MTDSEFDSRDKALLTRVVYGVLQHRMTLDFSLDSLLQNKKVDPWVKTLLRLSIYQLCYLDRIPPHAVVNEAVLIAKTN
ncbi:16S rRNA (cytosine(967)-C(5))-methyltransferase RsmB, partial [Escherichia coli]|nr:16S rRNA (cytosine(967)-C(5))-methyltransferase RsmB [Escherichia coli]